MPHTQDYTSLPTKLGIMLGSATLGLTLTDVDLILAIILKSVSIISFIIVIVINLPKFIDKLKTFFR
jgi:hypothetical protein